MFSAKAKTSDELEVVLQTIWEELPQGRSNKPVANCTRRLTVTASGGHFEHASMLAESYFDVHVIL